MRQRPEKMVRIIAAGPAGGSADIVARLLADGLGRQTGKPVIVEPQPSAGGVLAVSELSRAPHDGHTLRSASIPGQPRSSEDRSTALRAAYERNGAMLKAIGFKAD